MKKLIIIATLSIFLSACTNTPAENMYIDITNVNEEGVTTIETEMLNSILDNQTIVELTNDEITDLKYMREEEKLAHDVYFKLYETHKLQAFQNIANSELTHTEAVKTLLENYKIDDPAENNTQGEFENEALQELYTTLTKQGEQNLKEALKVGALIEEIDIIDLQNAIQRTENNEIITVYENLMKGSRNHLRAFVKNIEKNGNTYTNQKLSELEYNEIINIETEKGRESGVKQGPKRGAQ